MPVCLCPQLWAASGWDVGCDRRRAGAGGKSLRTHLPTASLVPRTHLPATRIHRTWELNDGGGGQEHVVPAAVERHAPEQNAQ